MLDYVVDLDLCLIDDYDCQYAVAVRARARDRADAAAVAMLIASELEFEANDGSYRRADKVFWRAVENGVEDGFDLDWRDRAVNRPDATPHN